MGKLIHHQSMAETGCLVTMSPISGSAGREHEKWVKTPKTARHVQFATAARGCIATPFDHSPAEFSACFYSKEEYRSIRQCEAAASRAVDQEPADIQHRMHSLYGIIGRSAGQEVVRKSRIVRRLILLEQEQQMTTRRRSSRILSSKCHDLTIENRLLAEQRAEYLADHVAILCRRDRFSASSQGKPSSGEFFTEGSNSLSLTKRWSGEDIDLVSPKLLKAKIDEPPQSPSRKLSMQPPEAANQ